MFWENAVEYLRNSECLSFQTVPIVFSSRENLLVGISGALGMTGNHFLSKNVFQENAVEYLRNNECQSFQTFAIVLCPSENLLVEISGAVGMKLGVDLPNLNSSWPQDVSTSGTYVSRYRGRSAKFELVMTTRCQSKGYICQQI